MRPRTLSRDLSRLAWYWLAIPIWALVGLLVAAVLSHGCVDEADDDGCYQSMENGSVIVRDIGTDIIVSSGDSPWSAWKNAPHVCRNRLYSAVKRESP